MISLVYLGFVRVSTTFSLGDPPCSDALHGAYLENALKKQALILCGLQGGGRDAYRCPVAGSRASSNVQMVDF